jgi:hypothetical protein
MGKNATICRKRKCNGKIYVKYSYIRPNGDKVRKKVCDTCKSVNITIEVPRDKYQRMRKLAINLQNDIREFRKK